MQAAKLRHRITIDTATTTQNSFGEPTASWATTYAAWASIEPLNGRELIQAQQVQSEVTHRVILRHRDSVTPRQRVSFGSRTLEILYVINPDERNERLELLCKETA